MKEQEDADDNVGELTVDTLAPVVLELEERLRNLEHWFATHEHKADGSIVYRQGTQ